MNEVNRNYCNMSIEVTSTYPVEIDDDLELGLGLSIGCGGLKKKEEASRRLTSQDLMSSCSSTSSSSVNNPNSFIVGAKRIAAIDSVTPNSSSVVGWPPIRKGHRMPILANRIKLEHDEFSKKTTNGRRHHHHHHLSVKVNMDGTPIGRKVDLFAQTSYEMLAQTLDDMFYGIHKPSNDTSGTSRLLNGTSEYVLTYEDRDGDCMLVGDVPWLMFLSSVKRLRILKNPNLQH